jgi:hypothetical protein
VEVVRNDEENARRCTQDELDVRAAWNKGLK